VEIKGTTAITIAIPQKYCEDLATQASAMLAGRTVNAIELRRFTGRCSWAGGIVPCVASVLQPCWAALAEAGIGSSSTVSSSSSWRPRGGVHGRVVLTAGSVTVPTARVAHALEWIREFARGQAGAVSRTYTGEQLKRPISVIITTDASPWGYGGFVMKRTKCVGFFFQEITAEDIARFGIVVGEAKFQALLENIALLIAVRLWAGIWAGQRLAIGLRSDSMAALMAWRKERSRVPAINAITREVSLDLADGLYTVDALEHIPGKLNEWADNLSRQFVPGNIAKIPAELLAVKRFLPGPRTSDWWRLEAKPSDCIGVAVTED
jgi:hypothetical protein